MPITKQQLAQLNNKIPLNYLWDGFWIDSFKRNTLNISASFNRIYYRDIMIVYKGVTFFNLPKSWRDTEIRLPFMRIEEPELFAKQHPVVEIENKVIIAWKIGNYSEGKFHPYHIVCNKVFVFKCEGDERNFDLAYNEPLQDAEYLKRRFENRIPILKSKII